MKKSFASWPSDESQTDQWEVIADASLGTSRIPFLCLEACWFLTKYQHLELPQHLSGTSYMHSSGGEAGVQGEVGVGILSSVWCLSGEGGVLSLGYGCVCILAPVSY